MTMDGPCTTPQKRNQSNVEYNNFFVQREWRNHTFKGKGGELGGNLLAS
jgi:hypothetical protein